MTIVTTHYRDTHPPKRRKRAALEVPTIVRAAAPRGGHRRPAGVAAKDGSLRPEFGAGDYEPSTSSDSHRDYSVTAAAKAPRPADDRGPRKSAIATARRPGKRYADAPGKQEAAEGGQSQP